MGLRAARNSTAPTTPQRGPDAITATFGGANAPLIGDRRHHHQHQPQDTVDQLADGIRRSGWSPCRRRRRRGRRHRRWSRSSPRAGRQHRDHQRRCASSRRDAGLERKTASATILVTARRRSTSTPPTAGRRAPAVRCDRDRLSLILLDRLPFVRCRSRRPWATCVGRRRPGAVVVVFQGAGPRPSPGSPPDRSWHPADLRDGRALRARHGPRDVPGVGDARGLRRRGRLREAVKPGLRASARVVTAAALIMTTSSSPSSRRSSAIQQNASGWPWACPWTLLVRMTLVPAVLVLLDHPPGGCPMTREGCPRSTSRARRCTARSPSRTRGGEGRRTCRPGPRRLRRRGPGRGLAVAGRSRVAVPDGTTRGPWPGSSPHGADRPAASSSSTDCWSPAARGRRPANGPARADARTAWRARSRTRSTTGAAEAISGRRRRALTGQALGLVLELPRRNPQGAEGSVASAVVEAALGLGKAPRCRRLGLEDQRADRQPAERLAGAGPARDRVVVRAHPRRSSWSPAAPRRTRPPHPSAPRGCP